MSAQDDADQAKKRQVQQVTSSAPSIYEHAADSPFQSLDGQHEGSIGMGSVSVPMQLGPYELLESIGTGGVGAVFKARERDSHQTVAVKILRHGIVTAPEHVQRFEKEARILAKIDSPYIIRHLNFGRDQGQSFIASEYVAGRDLRSLVPEISRAHPTAALLIIRDVLRGLDVMHGQSIIHRDVKPANIMVVWTDALSGGPFSRDRFDIAKLTDFGLARQLEQSESMALTQTQTTLGTPLYMAPEQQSQSRAVGATADVYSVGATLYHLLVGTPPFQADNLVELARMHRDQTPRSPRRADSRIGVAVDQLILKALTKEPNGRYQTGGEMLADVDKILDDRPTTFHSFPSRPANTFAPPRTFSFTCTLETTPAKLWPFIAETDRFNRALQLPPPDFSFAGTGRDRKIMAAANFNGLKVRWREHPFQWTVNQQLSVLREFENGPFTWVSSSVFLEPLTESRTRLIHEFEVLPRGLLGRLVTALQFGWVTPRQLKRVYQRIEQLALDSENVLACDAALNTVKPTRRQQQERLARAETNLKARWNNTQQIELLSRYVCQASDRSVARIQPRRVAQRWGIDTDDAIGLCLQATCSGLLSMFWDIICPICRIATTTRDSIEQIENHVRCDVCELEFEPDFGRNVELIFRAHPDIRTFDIRTYCIGGPFHSPHVLAQNRIEVGKKLEFGTPLSPGRYQIYSPQLETDQELHAREDGPAEPIKLVLPETSPTALSAGTGTVSFQINNASSDDLLTRLQRTDDSGMAITAAQIQSHPVFQQTFAGEMASVERLVQNQYGYFVAIQLHCFEEIIESLGEVETNAAWQKWLQEVNTAAPTIHWIEQSFDRMILATESTTELCSVCSNLSHLPFPLNTWNIVLADGHFQMTQLNQEPKPFGRIVRETRGWVENGTPGVAVVSPSIAADSEFQQWATGSWQKSSNHDLRGGAPPHFEIYDII